jgi:Flp pilus assembly protein TadG
MKALAKSFVRNTRGGAGLEFAVIGPAIVVLLIGVTDLGLGFYRRMQAQTAAQRGAMYATVNGYVAASISSTITSTRGSIAATPAPSSYCACPTSSGLTTVTCGSTCTIGTATVNAGRYVSASAQTTYSTIFRYPGLTSPMTFSATQVVRIQ